ncbi:thioredoxin family protein [Rhodopseudomonas palustris]|uniref:SoxW family protein n=1 Tax=Rhodopseudomonas palustris TaxID=1076 RepID=UPI002ACE1DAF|nr:thioredoxin family protein [Rhodopseudomonas palustris]WQG99281.1 thioredoxin family protein [Rhodopseudomonas palustris]
MIDRAMSRRHALAALGGIGAGALGLRAKPARAKPVLGDDGLYQLDWYLQSFLDLKDDLDGATAKGKRFAILWGLKGCPSCKKLHEVHFSDPAIEGYIREHFEIVHLNHIGAREVTDFDGGRLGEKAFAQAYGIRFTPTLQFFPESSEGLGARKPQDREVARLPGLLEPPEFLAMFRYVREKGYQSMPFTDWLKKPA